MQRRGLRPKTSWAFALAVFLAVFLVTTVQATQPAELHITVLLDEEDISLAAQVIIMGGAMPHVLEEGEIKVAALAPGAYELMAVMAADNMPLMPAQKKIQLEAGETAAVTMELQPIPGFSLPDMSAIGALLGALEDNGEGMPDIPEIPEPSRPEETPFDPAEAECDTLLAMLVSDDPGEYQAAEAELKIWHRRREAAPYLVEELKNHDGADRRRIMGVLVSLGAEPPDGMIVGRRPIDEMMPEIVSLLSDADSVIRGGAAQIVADAWFFPEEAVQALAQLLSDPERQIRLHALEALASSGRRPREHTELLLTALNDPLYSEDTEMRLGAVRVLGRLDQPPSETALAVSINLLDSDAGVREAAARVLFDMQNAAAVVMEDMLEALDDPEPAVTLLLLRTMVSFPSELLSDYAADIAPRLEHEHSGIRYRAAEVLFAAGPGALPVLPAIQDALRDDDYRVAQTAVYTIWRHFGAEAEVAIPELTELIQKESRDFSEAAAGAAHALATIGAPAVPVLLDLLYSDDPGTKYRAATALNVIGAPAEEAVSRLMELVEDEAEHVQVRRAAFNAVTSITGEEPDM